MRFPVPITADQATTSKAPAVTSSIKSDPEIVIVRGPRSGRRSSKLYRIVFLARERSLLNRKALGTCLTLSHISRVRLLLMNPQQVLPGRKVTIECPALRDLVLEIASRSTALPPLAGRSQTSRYCFRAWYR
jgi:hypothetical protein